MRELRVIGLEPDTRSVVCQVVDDGGRGEKFRLPTDDKLRAAARGDLTRLGQIEIEMDSQLRPKEIQSRIRAGATVEQVATAAGVPPSRVERFAYPVLLERSRAAELATAAHPVRADGPTVMTLLEIVEAAFGARGHSTEANSWDAWKGTDGHWIAELKWRTGRSDNKAHWRFAPGAHGGIVTPLDDAASELIDPDFARPLRTIAPVHQLATATVDPAPAALDEAPSTPEPTRSVPAPIEAPKTAATEAESAQPAAPSDPIPKRAPQTTHERDKRGKPTMPSWEDVLLGVRSNGRG